MPIDLTSIKPSSVYSVPEASKILGKSDQAIRMYIKDGKLKAKKGNDKRWRVEGQELRRFINGVSRD